MLRGVRGTQFTSQDSANFSADESFIQFAQKFINPPLKIYRILIQWRTRKGYKKNFSILLSYYYIIKMEFFFLY